MKITAIPGALQNHQALLSRLQLLLEAKDFSTRVIFPTLSMLKAVQEELLIQTGRDGIGGIRFLLFEGFIQETLQHFSLPSRVPEPIIQELLISEAFNKLKALNQLDYLDRVPFSSSYRRAILDGMSEWQRSYLTSELFQHWALGKEPKLRQLALLYTTYAASLEQNGYILDECSIRQLNQFAANCGSNDRYPVILYGFTDLTPIQTKYIDGLGHWFDFEAMIDPTDVPEFQRLAAQHFQIPMELPKPTPPLAADGLRTLQAGFWVHPPIPNPLHDNDASLQLIQAAGRNKLALGIAREISFLMRQNPQYNLADFLILSPQPLDFVQSAIPVFSEYQLPLTNKTMVLKDSPVVNRFSHACAVVAEDWKWPQMEVFIRHCYAGRNSVAGDRLLLELGSRYGALSGRERWLKICRDNGFKQYFLENELNLFPLEEGIRFLESIPLQGSLTSYLNLTRQWFLAALNTALPAISQGNDRDFNAKIQPIQLLQQVLQVMDELLNDIEPTDFYKPEISLTEFQEFWMDYILPLEIKVAPNKSKSGLRVMVPKEARGLHAKVVFITGLEQGTFPRSYIHDWKLSLAERLELKTLGVELETGEQYQTQERLAFYWALQAARERLYFVYQDQDSNGQPLNPSSFLTEIWQWFPDLQQRVKKYPLAPEPIDYFENCYSEYETRSRFASYLTGSTASLPQAEVIACFDLVRSANYREIAIQIGDKSKLLDQRADLFFKEPSSLQLLGRLFNEEYPFAITALEDFRGCPYRFFLKHVLKVRPLRKPQLLPDHLELGNLYHQVFQEFYNYFQDQKLLPDKADYYQQTLVEAFKNFYREWEEEAANELVKLVLALQEGQIRTTLNRWLQAELQWVENTAGRFQAKFSEFGFGLLRGDFDPASIPSPYQIDYDGTRFQIWGKVDRIDTDATGNFIVYDYKLGRGPTTKDLLEINYFQIPVYLMALEELYFGAGKGVGGCYLGLKEPSRSRGGVWRQDRLPGVITGKGLVDQTAWQTWQAEVKKALADIVQAIRNGRFFPTTPSKCPIYCEYKSCCRITEREVEPVNETDVE